MKNLIRFSLLIVYIFFVASVFDACKKDNTTSGMPDPLPVPTPQAPDPIINSFSPTYGIIGDTLTITGTNFSTTDSSNIVTMGGVNTTVVTATATQLTIIVPQGSATGSILVTVNGKTASSAGTFTLQGPIITNFQPTASQVGDSVTISGINFSSNTSVDIVSINGTPANVVSATKTQLIVIVPSGATTGKISVSVMGQGISTATDFTVSP